MFANTQILRNNDRDDDGGGPGDEGPNRQVHDIHMNAGQADASGNDAQERGILTAREAGSGIATGRSSSLLPASSEELVDETFVFEKIEPLGPDRMEVENEDEFFDPGDGNEQITLQTDTGEIF
jgi:hypothetical protein